MSAASSAKLDGILNQPAEMSAGRKEAISEENECNLVSADPMNDGGDLAQSRNWAEMGDMESFWRPECGHAGLISVAGEESETDGGDGQRICTGKTIIIDKADKYGRAKDLIDILDKDEQVSSELSSTIEGRCKQGAETSLSEPHISEPVIFDEEEYLLGATRVQSGSGPRTARFPQIWPNGIGKSIEGAATRHGSMDICTREGWKGVGDAACGNRNRQ